MPMHKEDQKINEEFVAHAFCPRYDPKEGQLSQCRGNVVFTLETENEEQVVWEGQCGRCGTRFLLISPGWIRRMTH